MVLRMAEVPSEARIADLVAKSKLFALLDDEGRARIGRIAEALTFPAGTTLIQEGEQGDAFYASLSGVLKVSAADFADEAQQIATLEPGSVFGEIAALTGEPRTATVVAESEVQILKFEMVSVFGVLKDYPDVLAELKRLGLTRTEDLLTKMMGD